MKKSSLASNVLQIFCIAGIIWGKCCLKNYKNANDEKIHFFLFEKISYLKMFLILLSYFLYSILCKDPNEPLCKISASCLRMYGILFEKITNRFFCTFVQGPKNGPYKENYTGLIGFSPCSQVKNYTKFARNLNISPFSPLAVWHSSSSSLDLTEPYTSLLCGY